MPAIDIQVLEGVFTPEEKAEMIARVTAAFGEVAGETMRQNTSCRVHEIRSGDWGYAGRALTTEVGLEMRRKG
jgi:4-oxalocrotonate tautomerase